MLALWLAAFGVASAAEMRSGDTVVVGADEVIADDLYISGDILRIEGRVEGDVVAAGREVRIAGPVGGDVIAAGRTIEVTAPVDGSVRAAGATVIVGGAVAEDTIAAGGEILLLPSASVGRDLWVAGGNALVQAPVRDEVNAAAGGVVLDGRIGGDVQAETGSLLIGPRAVVSGDLAYESDNAALIAPTAEIIGQVERDVADRPGDAPGAAILWGLMSWLRALVGLFGAGLLLLLVLPRVMRRATEELRAQPGTSAGYGLLALVAVPILASLMFAIGLLIGGWWVGVAVAAVLGIGLLVGFEAAGLFVGWRVLKGFGARRPSPVLALLIGLVLLSLLATVPLLGFLMVLAAVLFGLGALVLSGVQARYPRHA